MSDSDLIAAIVENMTGRGFEEWFILQTLTNTMGFTFPQIKAAGCEYILKDEYWKWEDFE